jgi:hypothetical protein
MADQSTIEQAQAQQSAEQPSPAAVHPYGAPLGPKNIFVGDMIALCKGDFRGRDLYYNWPTFAVLTQIKPLFGLTKRPKGIWKFEELPSLESLLEAEAAARQDTTRELRPSDVDPEAEAEEDDEGSDDSDPVIGPTRLMEDGDWPPHLYFWFPTSMMAEHALNAMKDRYADKPRSEWTWEHGFGYNRAGPDGPMSNIEIPFFYDSYIESLVIDGDDYPAFDAFGLMIDVSDRLGEAERYALRDIADQIRSHTNSGQAKSNTARDFWLEDLNSGKARSYVLYNVRIRGIHYGTEGLLGRDLQNFWNSEHRKHDSIPGVWKIHDSWHKCTVYFVEHDLTEDHNLTVGQTDLDFDTVAKGWVSVLAAETQRQRMQLQERIRELRVELAKAAEDFGKQTFIQQTIKAGLRRKLRKVLDELRAYPLAQQLRVTQNSIVMVTKDIEFVDQKLVHRYLGCYEVTYDLRSGFYIRNLALDPTYNPDKAIHPHGWNTDVCLGSYHDALTMALTSFDFYTAFLTVLEFLQTVNPNDSGAVSKFNTKFPERKPENPVKSKRVHIFEFNSVGAALSNDIGNELADEDEEDGEGEDDESDE